MNIQGTKEWLENRKNFIGASDASTVMGISPFSTPYKLWKEKLGLSEGEISNPAMERGNRLEAIAREKFNIEKNTDTSPKVIYHPKQKFMMASLDGLSSDGKIAVEIKCLGKEKHEMAKDGVIPKYYYCQIQHQLACLNINSIWYYSFDGCDGVSVKVSRDDEYIIHLIEEERKFWELVETFTAPPLTDKDYVEKSSYEFDCMGQRFIDISNEIARLEVEKKYIRNKFIEYAEGQSTKFGKVSLSRTFPKGRVDYSKIPEIKKMDLSPYRSESKEIWTLRKVEND